MTQVVHIPDTYDTGSTYIPDTYDTGSTYEYECQGPHPRMFSFLNFSSQPKRQQDGIK